MDEMGSIFMSWASSFVRKREVSGLAYGQTRGVQTSVRTSSLYILDNFQVNDEPQP